MQLVIDIMNRKSNFELLRLILMLMIVVHHCIVIGLGLEGLSPQYACEMTLISDDVPLMLLINSFCIIAVNVFVLMSGYFTIKARPGKILNLLFAIYFYTVLFTTIPLVFHNNIIDGIIKLDFFSQQSNYWFMREYFILMLFSPLLNYGIQNYSQRACLLFIIGQIFVACYLGFIFGRSVNQNGYNFVNFILLYSIGGYLRKYTITKMNKSWGLVYVVLSLITAMMCIYFFNRGANEAAWKLTYYNNPIIIMASIALFLFFKSVKIQNKCINKIAQSSLSIYLFGCSTMILQNTSDITKDLYTKYANDKWEFGIILITISLVTALLAIVIDQLRLYLWKWIESKILKISSKIL